MRYRKTLFQQIIENLSDPIYWVKELYPDATVCQVSKLDVPSGKSDLRKLIGVYETDHQMIREAEDLLGEYVVRKKQQLCSKFPELDSEEIEANIVNALWQTEAILDRKPGHIQCPAAYAIRSARNECLRQVQQNTKQRNIHSRLRSMRRDDDDDICGLKVLIATENTNRMHQEIDSIRGIDHHILTLRMLGQSIRSIADQLDRSPSTICVRLQDVTDRMSQKLRTG